MNTTTSNIELCPKCCASIVLTSYRLPFKQDFTRVYCNPSTTNKSSIERSLSNTSAELATLTEEIKLLVSALKTHHTHLERYIYYTTCFIQLSPICQLPTKVLGIIFAAACTSFQKTEYRTPLSISLVCSKWCDISLSTPVLWTNIYVTPYSHTACVPVYQHYLQRCGGIPICIKVKIPVKVHPHQYNDDGDHPFGLTYKNHIDVMANIYESFAQ